MFEIKCLVDEKHLPKALYALDGLVGNLQVIPVRNARVTKGGKIKAITQTGSIREGIIKAITDNDLLEITAAEVTNIAKEMGKTHRAGYSTIHTLIAQKVLKPIPGKRGEYKVL